MRCKEGEGEKMQDEEEEEEKGFMYFGTRVTVDGKTESEEI